MFSNILLSSSKEPCINNYNNDYYYSLHVSLTNSMKIPNVVFESWNSHSNK